MMSALLSVTLAVSMLAAQKSTTDCLTYFPMGDSFGYSSDDGGSGTSYLGVDTRNLTKDRISDLQLKDDNGVEVTMVDQDAPAGKAGIKERDVILTVNGTQVQSVEQLRRLIREIPPGREVTLGLIRNGQPLTVKAELTDRKNTFVMPAIPAIPAIKMKPFKVQIPDISILQDMDIPASVVVVHSSARSGLMVENLTPQLGTFFGVKDGQGILVRSVEKGSVAEKAGFRAGDVIVKVNNDPITDTGDFTHTLRSSHESGKATSVNVGIIRDKKEQNLTITLQERKQSEMREESLELPEVEAETTAELDAMKSQMALLKPEMLERQAEILRLQPEVEKMSKETVEQQKEMQKEMQELQKEMQEEQKNMELAPLHISGGADI